MKLSALVIGTTLAAAGVSAQSSSPAFEVASIKRNATGRPNANAARVAGNRYRAENVSLISLLHVAYGVQEFQIAGTGVSMAEFVMRLSRSIGVTVVDGTGLTGTFDLKLTWPMD